MPSPDNPAYQEIDPTVVGEIVELDFESDPEGTIAKVRVPHGSGLGHWWVSLAPINPKRPYDR